VKNLGRKIYFWNALCGSAAIKTRRIAHSFVCSICVKKGANEHIGAQVTRSGAHPVCSFCNEEVSVVNREPENKKEAQK